MRYILCDIGNLSAFAEYKERSSLVVKKEGGYNHIVTFFFLLHITV